MADTRSKEDRLLKDALSEGPACATLPALGALRNASLPQTEAATLQQHLTGCVRCQTQLRLLAEFENAAPRQDEEEDVSWIAARLESQFSTERPAAPATRGQAVKPWRRASRFRPAQVGGFALAASMLVAAIGIGLREARPPALGSPPPERMVFRSGELSISSPTGELREAPAELRWQPWAAAATYSVRVLEVDRTELWRAETAQTVIALPAEVRARIVPRKPLLWEVIARDAAGRVLASSGTHRFQIRNQP